MLKSNSPQNSMGIFSNTDAPLANPVAFAEDANASATAKPEADCAFVQANLPVYLDAELAPRPHNAVANHLDDCPACMNLVKEAERVDEFLRGEWSREASLPSACEVQIALDSIMDALPPQPEATPRPRVPHSNIGWVRFSAGVAGVVLFLGLLWSSYQVGYSHGVSHAHPNSTSGSENDTLHPQPTSAPSEIPTPSPPPPNSKSHLKLI